MVLKLRKFYASAIRSNLLKARPDFKGKIPNGCLFAPLLKKRELTFSHPLDDEKRYHQFLKDDLPLECIEFTPKLPNYTKRLIELIKYTTPIFHTCWTFTPELVYLMTAPKEQLTDENLKRCRILRACVELKFSFSGVIDDIADKSDIRCGRPPWKDVCREGIPGAIFDGMILDYLPYFLVTKYFKGRLGYSQILETLTRASAELIIGETLDVMGQHSSSKSISESTAIHEMKAGSYLAMQPLLGMLHAGITDEDLHSKMRAIYSEFGKMIQSWDDFCDYYCSVEQTGKPPCDFNNAGTTWASSKALELFSESQRNIFEECYGSTDPNKMEIVFQLYDSVDLPYHYIKYMENQAKLCLNLINNLDHEGLKKACISYLRWLVGDEVMLSCRNPC